jgi:hypothetical protein
MSDLKTKRNNKSVTKFLNGIRDEKKRKDSKAIVKMMEEATQSKASMWGDNIIGFGSYRYKYASGREGDWMKAGFSPRKQYLSVYIMTEFAKYSDLFRKLGKHKTGKCCVNIRELEDIDFSILKKLVKKSVQDMK